MKKRVLTAVIGIPLLLAFIYFDFPLNTTWLSQLPLLVFLIGAAAVLGSLEFYRLGSLAGGRPLTILGTIGAFAFTVGALFDNRWVVPALVAIAILLPLFLSLVFRKETLSLSWGWTVAGMLYMGWMPGHYVALRQLDGGMELVILAMFTTFACDTSAFLIGRTWGRHHMTPRISPKKTWEGAVAGFVGAVAASLALCFLLNLGDWSLPLSYAQAAIVGCLVGVAAQLGDLLESLLKRRAGVKDSGNLIPGHGGILDRIDSLVFTGVIVYYFVIWVD